MAAHNFDRGQSDRISLTHDLYLQSPVSYGHDPLICKSSRSTVSRFRRQNGNRRRRNGRRTKAIALPDSLMRSLKIGDRKQIASQLPQQDGSHCEKLQLVKNTKVIRGQRKWHSINHNNLLLTVYAYPVYTVFRKRCDLYSVSGQ